MTSTRNFEDERIAALRRHGLLDAASDQDLDRVVKLAQTLLGSESAAISLIDRDRQFLISRCGIEEAEAPRDSSFCTHTIRTDQPMVVPDATLDPRFIGNPYVVNDPKIRFYAGVPLTTADAYPLGALCVFDSTPRSITAEQLASLEQLAALAIQQLELRKLATIDTLTGVLNRPTILKVASHEIEDAKLHGRELAVLMVDLDHFKTINDEHGHFVGDAVLETIGQVLERALRKSDYVGRYGGEEFCVILPGVDADQALHIARRLRAAVESATIECDGRTFKVTASIGMAVFDEHHQSMPALLSTADKALYTAKGRGRNRVVFEVSQPSQAIPNT
ncbi:sensor domain-containing diguanylate cyclase [Pelagibacterium montanilacus]|uniref:sensor domain-containing diguanylate cyclase n=1 Tax=Pelagibacterium montanilacus TaxID=2185280 RepID=UPI000F8F562A|nr:sensor domain-containing diguanylate cyclase [Pelagibacterium montanilacus]